MRGAVPCAAAHDASSSKIPHCFLAHIFSASVIRLVQIPFELSPALSIAMALVAIRTAIHIAIDAAVVRVSLGFAMTIRA